MWKPKSLLDEAILLSGSDTPEDRAEVLHSMKVEELFRTRAEFLSTTQSRGCRRGPWVTETRHALSGRGNSGEWRTPTATVVPASQRRRQSL